MPTIAGLGEGGVQWEVFAWSLILKPLQTMWGSWKRQQSWEKIIAAPPAPRQCLLWNSQAADAPAAEKHQFSSLHMDFLPKIWWSLECGSSSEPLTSGRTRKSRRWEQPSSKWINHSENVQLVEVFTRKQPGVPEQNKTKSPNKSKPQHSLRCQKLSLLSRHKRKCEKRKLTDARSPSQLYSIKFTVMGEIIWHKAEIKINSLSMKTMVINVLGTRQLAQIKGHLLHFYVK